MQIGLSKTQIEKFVLKYDERMKVEDAEKESVLMKRMPEAAERGNMTRDDLIAVAKWKWRGGCTR